MLRSWRVWGVLTVALVLVAEALNLLVPEQELIQWLLFVLAVACFIIAITTWDSQQRSRRAGR